MNITTILHEGWYDETVLEVWTLHSYKNFFWIQNKTQKKVILKSNRIKRNKD